MGTGLLISDRHSFPPSWATRSQRLWRIPSGLWLKEVPLGCQENSRLGGWPTRWPISHNTQTKTQQVTRSWGQQCGDIELSGYPANTTGPVPLVMDLHITHDRFGSSTDPNLNGHLHYPNDIDTSLNEDATEKIRKYHSDYDNDPPNVKLTAFLHLQEFSLHNMTVDSSTTVVWCSPLRLDQNEVTSLTRR